MPFTAAALVTAGIGAYKAIKGAGDSADAKRRGKLNIRPTYDIAPEYFANQGIATNLAQGGLPESSKNFYETNAERGLGSSLGALLQAGGGVNSVADIYDKFDQNNRAIVAQDSQQKIDNIRNLMLANNAVADQRTQKWVLDKYQPYQDTAKSVAAQKAQGAGELNDGLNTISGAISSYAGANAKQEDTVLDPNKLAAGETPGTIGWEHNRGPISAAGESTAGSLDLSSPDSLPSYNIPQAAIRPGNPSAMNINLPDSYDGLNDFNTSSRSTVISGLLKKYQGSPYADSLTSYLKQVA